MRLPTIFYIRRHVSELPTTRKELIMKCTLTTLDRLYNMHDTMYSSSSTDKDNNVNKEMTTVYDYLLLYIVFNQYLTNCLSPQISLGIQNKWTTTE